MHARRDPASPRMRRPYPTARLPIVSIGTGAPVAAGPNETRTRTGRREDVTRRWRRRIVTRAEAHHNPRTSREPTGHQQHRKE
jgi:hypothetical protein